MQKFAVTIYSQFPFFFFFEAFATPDTDKPDGPRRREPA